MTFFLPCRNSSPHSWEFTSTFIPASEDGISIMPEYGTHIMAWGPFAEGINNFFKNEALVSIGEKYGYLWRRWVSV